jgi:hypothetical protein
MTPTTRNRATDQLAPYGYTLTDQDHFSKGGKVMGVVVTAKGKRFYAHTESGTKLWSGGDLGAFVVGFWFAKKVEV